MKMEPTVIKGRGATLSPVARFARHEKESVDDGWSGDVKDETTAREYPQTWLAPEAARSIVTRNESPDIPFDRSINPYRGCEHGCVYCFARPSHSYVDLSPGIDFETRIFYKENAAALLEQTLRKPGYRCRPIAMGTNTDPYQGAERTLGITRELLQVMQRYRHPVTIVTKGALIERDIDILSELAKDRLASVMLSVTTLDNDLKRRLEPRTPSGKARLNTVRALIDAGIPTGVMVAPVIPAINDHEIEAILHAAHAVGVRRAAYILVRLPHEVKDLFRDWLAQHYPERAGHVMSLIRQSRGGKDNDPRFGHRMRGDGVFASMIKRRFDKTCRELGLHARESAGLDTTQFALPEEVGDQLSLL
ncbi:MAG: PA0069 family radical SAM protein [Gammaproteobacteria bacterium]